MGESINYVVIEEEKSTLTAMRDCFEKLHDIQVDNMIAKIRIIHEAIRANREIISTAKSKLEERTISRAKFRVALLLNQYGVPSNLAGYQYLTEAITMMIEEPNASSILAKFVYPKLAEKHLVSPMNIERSIRRAIKTAWVNTAPATLEMLYGNAVNPKRGYPTNAEFIINVTQKLRADSPVG